mgnify:FL=1
MPVIFGDRHTCDRCSRKFDWVYFDIIRSKLSSGIFKVEKIPDETKAYRVEALEDGSHRIYINCPFCGADNRFIYNKNSV